MFVRSARSVYRHRRVFEQVEAFCMFMGYPRSGSSLIGAILDAHPEVVLGHELHALPLLRVGFRRNQIWALILERNAEFVAAGSRGGGGYDYAIDGQWQGRWSTMRVIGDKKAGGTTRVLGDHPETLDRLRRTMKVPVRIVHVVRNPFDNITTMAAREHETLERAADLYFRRCDTVDVVRSQLTPSELIDVRHEQMIAEPRSTIAQIVQHVGLVPSDDYLDACASTVSASPHRSRKDAPWTPELIAHTSARIAQHEFLSGYDFDN